MRQARCFAIPLLVVLAALWLSEGAAAQAAGTAGPPRAEIWGGLAVAMPVSNGALTLDHEPPMRLGGTPLESRAHQVLNVETGVGRGMDFGANVYFNRVFGVQGAFTAASADVGAMNADYTTSLRYISLPPPDYRPTENTISSSTPWEPTAGTLGRRALALGGVVRWGTATGRVGGTLAGGVDIEWLTGELDSAGYTQFILGGHSTLFGVTHRVRVRPAGGERAIGPYVGGDVHVALGTWAAITAGGRVRLTSGRSVPVEVMELVDPSENPWVPELADVAAALDGQLLELPGMRWHIGVGLKVFVR
ncbi:MAG TPA: hypothetical protein VLN08_13390 [Vicinamibacterales bacterium]|nr:hypothetical protein [Vicinamibacterales bacterium]